MRFISASGVFVLCLMASSAALADAIYLKDGNVIEGNILQTNDEWTLIKTGVRTLRYPAKDIERIEKDDQVIVIPGEEELTDAKRALIKGLLAANGVEKLIQKNIDSVVSQVPADRQVEMKEIFKKDILIELLVPIYAEAYSTQELEKIVNFFNSPAGQKFVELTPVTLEKTVQTLLEYFKSKSTL